MTRFERYYDTLPSGATDAEIKEIEKLEGWIADKRKADESVTGVQERWIWPPNGLELDVWIIDIRDPALAVEFRFLFPDFSADKPICVYTCPGWIQLDSTRPDWTDADQEDAAVECDIWVRDQDDRTNGWGLAISVDDVEGLQGFSGATELRGAL